MRLISRSCGLSQSPGLVDSRDTPALAGGVQSSCDGRPCRPSVRPGADRRMGLGVVCECRYVFPTEMRVVLSRVADVEHPADSAGALDRRIGAESRHQFHSTGIAPIDRLAALAEMGALSGPASADCAAGTQDRRSGRQTGQLPDSRGGASHVALFVCSNGAGP